MPTTAAFVVSFFVHAHWARDNCAYYCGFCGEFVGTTVPTTAAFVVSFLCTLTGPGTTVPSTAASVVSSLGQLRLPLRLLW